MSYYDDLRLVGYDEGHINDHAYRTDVPAMHAAGFTQDEIASHITGLANSGRASAAMLDRLDGGELRLAGDPKQMAEAQAAVPLHMDAVAAPLRQGQQSIPLWAQLYGEFLHGAEELPKSVYQGVRAGAQVMRSQVTGKHFWPGRYELGPQPPEASASVFSGPGFRYYAGSLVTQLPAYWAAVRAGATAGGVAGEALFPIGGGAPGAVIGGVSGAALLAAAQAIGPSYFAERAKTPGDPDGALERARQSVLSSGVFGGLSQAIFHANPSVLKSLLGRMGFQGLFAQPVVGGAQKIDQNLRERRPWNEGLGETYGRSAIGTILPWAGAHAISRTQKPPPPPPPPPPYSGWPLGIPPEPRALPAPGEPPAAAPGTPPPPPSPPPSGGGTPPPLKFDVTPSRRQSMGETPPEDIFVQSHPGPTALDDLDGAMRDGNARLVNAALLQTGTPIERTNPLSGESEAIGGIPSAQDFSDVARHLGDGTNLPQVRNGLIGRYESDGLHPAEIAADVNINPMLARFGTPEPPPAPAPLPPRDAPPATERLTPYRVAAIGMPPVPPEPPRLPEVPRPPAEPVPPPGAPGVPGVPPAPAPPPPYIVPPEREPPSEPSAAPPEGVPVAPIGGVPEAAPPPVEAPPEAPPVTAEPPGEPLPPVEALEPQVPEAPVLAEPAELPVEAVPDVSRETLAPAEVRPIVPTVEPNVYERYGEPPAPSNQNVRDTDLLWGPEAPREMTLEDTGDRGFIARDRAGDQLGTIVASWNEARQRYEYYASLLRDRRAVEIAGEREQKFDHVDDAQHYVERMVRGGRYDDVGHAAAMRGVQERERMRADLPPVRVGRYELPPATPFFDRIWNNYARRMTPEEFLRSEPAWSGARVLAEQWGWREREAFSYLANEMFSRMGATQRMTPQTAARFMARERGIRAEPDVEAGVDLGAEPQGALIDRLQTALKYVLHADTEEEVTNAEAAAREIMDVVDRALGPHVAELMLHPGAVISKLGLPASFQDGSGLDQQLLGLATHRKNVFGRVIASIMDIALGHPDREQVAFHEIEHVFENVVATDDQLDVLHADTSSLRLRLGQVLPTAPETFRMSQAEIDGMEPGEVRAESLRLIWHEQRRLEAGQIKRAKFLESLPKLLRAVFKRFYEIIDGFRKILARVGIVKPTDLFKDLRSRQIFESIIRGEARTAPARRGIPGGRYLQERYGEPWSEVQAMAEREPERSFTTVMGSRYVVHENGQTTRNKAKSNIPGHEGDFGPQERSEKTYYLTPQNANRLAIPSNARVRFVDHGDGTLTQVQYHEATGDWGVSRDPVAGTHRVPVETEPQVGLIPFELWKKWTTKGFNSYSKWHFGNEITEVRAPRAAAQPVEAAVRSAADAIAKRQGGISTVFIGDIIDSMRDSGFTAAQIHDAILSAGREGRATLAEASTLKVTPAQQEGAIRIQGERPFHTVTYKAPAAAAVPEPAAAVRPSYPAQLTAALGKSQEFADVYDRLKGESRETVVAAANEFNGPVASGTSKAKALARVLSRHMKLMQFSEGAGYVLPEPTPTVPVRGPAEDERAPAPAPPAPGPARPAPETEPAARDIRGPRRTGRAAADPKTWTLVEYLLDFNHRIRGLKPIPELVRALEETGRRGKARWPFRPGFGAVFREDGNTVKQALDLAKSGGYLPPDATEKQLVDMLTAGAREGRPALRMGALPEKKTDLERERFEQESLIYNAALEAGYPENQLDGRTIGAATDFWIASGRPRDQVAMANAIEAALSVEDADDIAAGESPPLPEGLPGFGDDVAMEPGAPPGEGAAIEDRAGARVEPTEPEGVEDGEYPRAPGDTEGETYGITERDVQESAPTPVEQASAERSDTGLDQPLPAGAQRAAWMDEAQLAREAARDNPQLGFDFNMRAAAAEAEAQRRTDPELQDDPFAALDEKEFNEALVQSVLPLLHAADPSSQVGGPNDRWDGGAGAGGSGDGGRLTAGDHAEAFNRAYYLGKMKTKHMNLVSRQMTSPQTLASLDTLFGRLWTEIRQRSIRMAELDDDVRRSFDSLHKLSRPGIRRVIAVMEMERLIGAGYDPGANNIDILNRAFPLAAHTPLGSVASISTLGEMRAYHDIRQFLQRRWTRDFKGAIAMRYGLHPAITAAQLIQLADRSVAGERKRFLRFAAVISAIENGERAGYIPFSRRGDYKIHVRAKGGIEYQGRAIEEGGETVWFRLLRGRSVIDEWMQRPGTVRDDVTGETVPEAAVRHLALARALFPGPDFEITFGQHTPTRDSLKDIGIPAIEKLMILVGSDLRGHVANLLGPGASAQQIRAAEVKFQDELINSMLKDIYEELKAGYKRRARNVPGYDPDLLTSLGNYAVWSTEHVANIETRDRIDEAVRNIMEQHPDRHVRTYTRNFMADIDSRPGDLDAGLRWARQGAFLWMLGFNLSSAGLSLIHDPMKASALIGATISAGMGKSFLGLGANEGTVHAMDRLGPMIMRVASGLRVDSKHGPYIDIEAMRLNPAQRALVRELAAKGVMRPQGGRTLSGDHTLTEGPGEFARSGAKELWLRISDYGGSLMHIVDANNRIAPGLVVFDWFTAHPEQLQAAHAYWAGIDEYYRKLAADEGVSPKTMARFIVEVVGGMNDPYNRMPVMRSWLGRMLFQFHTYTTSYLSQLYRMLRNSGPAGRVSGLIMLAQLWWLGGLLALPFAKDLIDWTEWLFEKLLGIEPELEHGLDALIHAFGFDDQASQAVLHGWPYARLGVDLSSRLGFGEEMRRALDSPFGPAASVSYRAMMEAWNRYQTGQDMASIVAAMSPNAIKSILLGYKVWPDQGVVNQFGQTVLNANELTPADRYWRMAGFQPSVASERYISRNEMQTRARFDRAEAANLNGRVARLVQEKAKAVNAGDSKTAAEVQKRIDEQITDGFKRGLITNSAAFLRALSARMAQDQSPLLNEIMKLPKNIRLEFLQRWLKQQGQRTAAPSSQAPPPPFVPPPPTYSLPPGHR